MTAQTPRRHALLITLAALGGLVLSGCAQGVADRAPVAEAAVGRAPLARGPFVSAANPHAVEAGMRVLRDGGSAVDAAVAIQAVLGLVEP